MRIFDFVCNHGHFWSKSEDAIRMLLPYGQYKAVGRGYYGKCENCGENVKGFIHKNGGRPK